MTPQRDHSCYPSLGPESPRQRSESMMKCPAWFQINVKPIRPSHWLQSSAQHCAVAPGRDQSCHQAPGPKSLGQCSMGGVSCPAWVHINVKSAPSWLSNSQAARHSCVAIIFRRIICPWKMMPLAPSPRPQVSRHDYVINTKLLSQHPVLV